jgi:hypothetical protein
VERGSLSCAPGSYLYNSTACAVCPAGSYCDGSGRAQLCDSGHYQPSTRSFLHHPERQLTRAFKARILLLASRLSRGITRAPRVPTPPFLALPEVISHVSSLLYSQIPSFAHFFHQMPQRLSVMALPPVGSKASPASRRSVGRAVGGQRPSRTTSMP